MAEQIKEQKAREVDISHIEEGWTKISLTNGDTIKMKIMVAAVFQLVDNNGVPQRLEDDSGPMYSVSNQMVVFVQEKNAKFVKGMN